MYVLNQSSFSSSNNITNHEYISEEIKQQTNQKSNKYLYNNFELIGYINLIVDISSSLVAGVNTGYISDKSQGNNTIDITDAAPFSPVQSPPPSTSFDPQIPPTLPISFDDLGTHVASCHSDGNVAFSEEYKIESNIKINTKSFLVSTMLFSFNCNVINYILI